MDHPEALRLEAAGLHARDHRGGPPRRIDRAHAAALPKEFCRCVEKVLQAPGDLVARHGLLGIRIDPAGTGFPVGRVEYHQVEGGCGQDRDRPADVARPDPDAVGQAVERGRTARPVDHLRLQLQGLHEGALRAGGQDQGEDAAPRSQVRRCLAGPETYERGQEQGVHGEPVAPLRLDDLEAPAADGVQGLVFLQGCRVFHGCRRNRTASSRGVIPGNGRRGRSGASARTRSISGA